jgi:Ca2+-transporting ATPase
LWLLLGGVSAILALAIFWPPAQRLFRFTSLSGIDLLICAGAGLICFVGLEGVKSLWFRRSLGASPA